MSEAIHLPDGNRFDRMRINLPLAYAEQTEALGTVQRRSVRRNWFISNVDLLCFATLRQLGLQELVVNNGVDRRWLEPFLDYWGNVLGGRPLTLMDFHNLRFQ